MPDIDTALVRPGDDAPAPTEPTPKKRKTAEPDPALAALQADNDALKAQLAELKQIFSSMVQPAAAPPAPKRDELDRSRPFAKHRNMGGGVTFEQDGRTFNAKGQLM